MTLYAQWDADSYGISFDPGGGSGQMGPVAAAYESAVALPACAFTRSGYAFDVWKCDVDGEEIYFEDRDVLIMPSRNLQLSAQWTSDYIQGNSLNEELK